MGGQTTLFLALPGQKLAFRKDVDNLKIVYYDTGHFALETHVVAISEEIINMFAENHR